MKMLRRKEVGEIFERESFENILQYKDGR